MKKYKSIEDVVPEMFASKVHYERFLYAWSLAEQVNKILDTGVSIFDTDLLGENNNKFVLVFEKRNGVGDLPNPTIRREMMVYYGWTWKIIGKGVYMPSIKKIQETFKSLKIMKFEELKIKF